MKIHSDISLSIILLLDHDRLQLANKFKIAKLNNQRILKFTDI